MLRLTRHDPCLTELDQWPADVDLICSAMDAARSPEMLQRRRELRRPHRVIASLQVAGEDAPVRLFSRDCDPMHLGFIAERPLPLGYRGVVEFVSPDGSLMSVQCTIQRSRECVPGWFEGVLTFFKPIPSLRLGVSK